MTATGFELRTTLVRKRILNHLAKYLTIWPYMTSLTKWLRIRLRTEWLWV